MKKIVALGTLIAMTLPVWAATQTATLSMLDMNCTGLTIKVKKVLAKASGVSKAEASLERHEAKRVSMMRKRVSKP